MVLVFPGISLAQSWVDELVRKAADGGGTVIIENHSSVSTGGQTAGSGERVVTDGDVSASSRSETYINMGSEGGSARVHVETSRNGETETRTYEKEVAADESMRLDISTRVDDNGTEVKATAEDESGNEEELAASSSTDSDQESTFIDGFERAMSAVPAFFSRVFGFFWSW